MKLFVYGTLRYPGAQRFGLGQEQLVAQGVKLNGFNLFDVSWFPGIKPSTDLSSVVVGDVYEVPDAAWGALDRYEGYPSLYRREDVTIEGIEGPMQTYVYNGNVDESQRLTTGEWKRHG